ncbi:class I adenylate-forming enzyme family protein [Saccharothrix australiensis]|uniref:Acyl-CoA synthetase (AMP-forming)/AMP-acid ligase II n=1 Tax=Saccharothrix australiensis TaxID=2072 RepID=A0A495W025_9PSEU|nr:class I adenylate-forming enzyme family protein [Saccharothrix australiensis]RKT54480.1 acyl-CoA synthetase (AMP-forming)/AMP-acid ligase II [Saccharothrix australiensis]
MTAKIFGPDGVQPLPEFERDALNMARELQERGVNHGDRVLLKAGNSAGYVCALLALMHVGASIVLVDHQEQRESTRAIIRQAGVKMCVVDDDAPLPDGVAHQVTVFELMVAASGRVPLQARLSVGEWCERPDGLVMWSSGSTGTPKGVVKSGGSFLRNLDRNRAQVGHVASDVLVPLLPFSHQYGLSMVLIAWLARCSLVIAPYKRLDRALTMAARCGGTVFDATPATYRSMLNLTRRRPALRPALDAARMLCVGAAPLDPNLVDEYVAEYGLPLLDSYGSTELGNVSFATPENPVACGRAMPGLELAVVDDDGNRLPAGEVGEVLVRTPDLMTGYLDQDGGVDPVRVDWYPSGDLGYLDERDNLHVLGRKLAVHRNGHTLYPEVIERRAARAGCSTKVVALPDDRRGSSLVFFVEDESGTDAAVWRERINEVLPPWEAPNRVVVVDRFPLNRNGKPDRAALERQALADAAAS